MIMLQRWEVIPNGHKSSTEASPLGNEPNGMLSPIATVVFPELGHPWSTKQKESFLPLALAVSTPCVIKALLNLLGHSLMACRLLLPWSMTMD